MITITLIKNKIFSKRTLTIFFLVVAYTNNVNANIQNRQLNSYSQLEMQLVQDYHHKLEIKYGIQPPKKYNIPINYQGIGSMHGPKGFYRPSFPNVIAICYGVYLTKEGRVLPDPKYADSVTIENTTRALRHCYELTKLEYLSIKAYNNKIAAARKQEEKSQGIVLNAN